MTSGKNFLDDVNRYASAVQSYMYGLAPAAGRQDDPAIALRFYAAGGCDLPASAKWYGWIRDSLFYGRVEDDLLWDFSVDLTCLRCKGRRRQSDGFYNEEPLNYGINWYYDTGAIVRRKDISEFLERCGLDRSKMPDFREDLIDI